MRYLCQNIQGCVLGYSQSDEISLILIDYQNSQQVPGLIIMFKRYVVCHQVWLH